MTTNEEIQAPTSTSGAATAADQAFNEIQSAAQEGETVMALAAAEGLIGANKQEVDTRTPEQIAKDTAERRERFKQRAVFQRERGVQELSKVYNATMTVPVVLNVNDRVVSSMVERFLGSIDRSLYVINRFGESVMSTKQTTELLGTLKRKFDELHEEANLELMKVNALEQVARDKFKANIENFDIGAEWFEPKYCNTTLSTTFQVKHPYTLQLIKTIKTYDLVIEKLGILNFNSEVDTNAISTIQDRQKMLIKNLFVLTIRSVSGMYRKTGQATSREKRNEQQISQTFETTEAVTV